MKNDDKFKIKILGVGDFGIIVIKDFSEKNLPNIECLDMNTDWAIKTANRFVKIGVKLTKGLGTGAYVEFGEKAAEEDREAITEAIKDCKLLIIVAGLGGGTGSGASPVVAEIAKELKITTVAFVTTPLELEGPIRYKNAQYGLEKLENIVDFLIVLSNEKYLSNKLEWRRKTLAEFFKETVEILKSKILEVIDLFNSKVSKDKSIKEILKEVKFDNYYIDIYTKRKEL